MDAIQRTSQELSQRLQNEVTVAQERAKQTRNELEAVEVHFNGLKNQWHANLKDLQDSKAIAESEVKEIQDQLESVITNTLT